MLNSGSKNLLITTIKDMSFWIDYLKEKNISNMKTVAFASAAHEFRNPLNAIVTSLDLLHDMIDMERGE